MSTAPALQESPMFTDRMRSASKKAHSVSDALVNAKLLTVFTTREKYGTAASQFYYIFHALEAQLQKHSQHPALTPLAALLPDVARAAGFEVDLEFYLGPGWREASKANAPVRQYIYHLEAIAKEDPALLLAHAYTQFAAQLAGGQIIKRLARRVMRLPEEQGTAAFEFQKPARQLKADWTAATNYGAIQLTPQQQETVLAEHVRVFALNNAIIRNIHTSWTDWPRMFIATVPGKVQLVLTVGVALSAWLAYWLMT